MAQHTNIRLRNQVMYSVFVRNHTKEGTFQALRKDLNRIKALGVDIIWLLPIHPVGEKERKGDAGSPYAIQDYRAINPLFGNLNDLKELVNDIHEKNMKCIIDVVYNHTSPDSVLVHEHPEWFFRKENGNFGNKIGEWLDVIDLDYTQPALWDYQIETLKQWAQIVDGFRCDVAPLIPLEFWLRARDEVATVNADCLWLSESVEPIFTIENRARGMVSLSDSEIYQAFDITYEYDIFAYFRNYLQGECSLAQYVERINQQEAIYPANYVKLRYLENHDNARAKFIIPNERHLLNWLAFIYFQKGMTLLYAGQEKGCAHLPSLFDDDPICWDSTIDFSPLMTALAKMKENPLFCDSRYEVKALPNDVIFAVHSKGTHKMIGIFSVKGNSSLLDIDVPSGCYKNFAGDKQVEVHNGKISTDGNPIIFEVGGEDA